jgi:Tetratricopeptide repeat
VRGGVLLTALVLAVGAWGVWRGAHHAVYEGVLVPLVAHRVAGDARTPEEVTRRLHEFVYLNLRMPFRAPVLKTDNREVLLRGFAFCDQAVYVFIHLLQEQEISGRMIFLYREDGVSPHSVAEVQLGSGWRVFDVRFGFTPIRPDGAVASVRDLVAQPALLGRSRVPVEWYRHAKVRLVRGPERRRQGGSTFTFARQAVVRRVVGHTPRWVADRLQDLYLWLPAAPVEDPRFAEDPAASRLFFRARHYHALLRSREATDEYREFLRRYPEHSATDHVRYYLGLIQFSRLEDTGAAIATFRELRDRFPGTVWRAEAEYLLARALEQAGNCGAARALYRRVRDGDGNGREDAEDRLGRLTCTRPDAAFLPTPPGRPIWLFGPAFQG